MSAMKENGSTRLPPPSWAKTVLPSNGYLQVTAHAMLDPSIVNGGIKVLGTMNGKKIDKESKDHILLQVLTARELLACSPPHFYVELNVELNDPQAFAAKHYIELLVLNAIVADRSLSGAWPALHTLTLGRCLNIEVEGQLVPLEQEIHWACLEAMKDASQLGALSLIVAPPPDTASVTLHQAILTLQPELDFWEVDRLSGIANGAGGNQLLHCATVLFPVVGEHDMALPVSLKLRQVDDQAEEHIDVVGSHVDQQRIKQILLDARSREPLHNKLGKPVYWRTIVSMPIQVFSGRSFELALILADRIARGREFAMQHPNKLYATGQVALASRREDDSAGFINHGEVFLPLNSKEDQEDQQAIRKKVELILKTANKGDRALFPINWKNDLHKWREQFAEKKISVAFIGNAFGGR